MDSKAIDRPGTAPAPEALAKFKENQKQGWAHFAPLEANTTPPAAQLVKFARVTAGQRLLDVACGTGVAAITAARLGAKVRALDLTPELLARARENAAIADVDVDWRQGDAEELPYQDGEFDVVLSQFGHMFAPRPDVVLGEMLRVLKPGGTIAFSTWPPEHSVGKMFLLMSSYMPPPPIEVPPPVLWGDPNIVRQRLGGAVKEIAFSREVMRVPTLSPEHIRVNSEKSVGPLIKLVEALSEKAPDRLAAFRREYDRLAAEYIEDNALRQDYLMTRALKV
ncbi:MAG TPA: class I SAM-dependent methyltransferase [Candidatus Eisenbacteria bacterium]|nr:class I SAM-dependent methyltransferase [Candidatus Eisenbacteria bacterium]